MTKNPTPIRCPGCGLEGCPRPHLECGLDLDRYRLDTPTPERVTLTDAEPTRDGWYAYDSGNQSMIFRLTRGQWYAIADNGESTPCAWGYIEQALSVFNLVRLDPAVRIAGGDA